MNKPQARRSVADLPEIGATAIIQEIAKGGSDATTLFSQLYSQLRRLAHIKLHRSGNISQLNTTSLVHESFLKLDRIADAPNFKDEQEFLSYAAKTMRSIVIDRVRARQAEHRAGLGMLTTLDTEMQDAIGITQERSILHVHEALDELSKIDIRLAQVVELRYFAGLTDSEIAAMLGITERTVQRDWLKAKVHLVVSLNAQ